MKDYFFARVAETIGAEKAGHRFIAVTDPGSSLEKVATKQGFARIFHGDPSIGGRYSVLSPFGLVPAATAGIDVRALIKHTLAMLRSCGPDVPPHENPGRPARPRDGACRPGGPRQGDDPVVARRSRISAPGPSN